MGRHAGLSASRLHRVVAFVSLTVEAKKGQEFESWGADEGGRLYLLLFGFVNRGSCSLSHVGSVGRRR